MARQKHREKEDLGGLVYLLTIDMSVVTGNPEHVLRFINHYGKKGEGVSYQGNQYQPHPYELKQVKRSAKNNSEGSQISMSEGDDLQISRFTDLVGGDLQDGRVTELKVFGKFLDGEPEANSLSYVKRLDHIIDYMSEKDGLQEVLIHTVDPLSRDIDVPSLAFTAGIANSDQSAINIFPAVDRDINQERG